MLALALIVRNAPSAATHNQRRSPGSDCSRPCDANAAPPSARSSPSASVGSAMKLLAYTHSGVVNPSTAVAASAALEPTPSRRPNK